ncbi:MAG: type II toxin-antitoxin system PrlF family antitoxin [Gomphosphaeria aponina SAG 52.96 = DSM 107014]|uniref:Type II toxin-antitoxin system PrlF family antitoxin n=1 Tax=Gomphosphaeria aponina SAG 52.96 = DSM 107014 TaxID=1521640 RepID=A0A941GWN5_9CHRO|nr:type II toxin-antitoxin system PrlF family antitoxin [Gomphosphaeria aponina SAG 52.96 = DSM 107014]
MSIKVPYSKSTLTDQTHSDPILGQFLHLLAQDIEKNPQHLKAISSDLVSRVQSLVSEVDFDIDAPLLDDLEAKGETNRLAKAINGEI